MLAADFPWATPSEASAALRPASGAPGDPSATNGEVARRLRATQDQCERASGALRELELWIRLREVIDDAAHNDPSLHLTTTRIGHVRELALLCDPIRRGVRTMTRGAYGSPPAFLTTTRTGRVRALARWCDAACAGPGESELAWRGRRRLVRHLNNDDGEAVARRAVARRARAQRRSVSSQWRGTYRTPPSSRNVERRNGRALAAAPQPRRGYVWRLWRETAARRAREDEATAARRMRRGRIAPPERHDDEPVQRFGLIVENLACRVDHTSLLVHLERAVRRLLCKIATSDAERESVRIIVCILVGH